MTTGNTHSGQDFSQGKIDCPDCGAAIPLDFRKLMVGLSAVCPSCKAELSLDMEASRSTIDALRDAQQAMSDATGGQIRPLPEQREE